MNGSAEIGPGSGYRSERVASSIGQVDFAETGATDDISYIGRGQTLLQSRRAHAEAKAALLGDSGNRDGYYD